MSLRSALAISALLHGLVVLPWVFWPQSQHHTEERVAVELMILPPTSEFRPIADAQSLSPPPPMPIASAPLRPFHIEPKHIKPKPAPAALTPSPPSSFSRASDAAAMSDHGAGTDPPVAVSSSPRSSDSGITRGAAYQLGSADTPLPEYPWNARRRGREGRVVIEMIVDAEGQPLNLSVVDSSGDDALDRAAMDTLSRWRLIPAMENGIRVTSRLRVPIRFELKKTELTLR
jgi:periplasmic protein TonB